MSYTAITTGEIASGEPVKADTQTKIKDNFEDHESRIQTIETGAGTTYPPMTFRINGPYGLYSSGSPFTDITRTTTNFNITITGVRVLIDTAGSSGTTEVDVLFKRGAGSWTSILTTKPSAGYASGNNYASTNGVVNATYADLLAGDLIRLDITSVQAGAASGFTVRIDYAHS
jgi:hypothetical protein